MSEYDNASPDRKQLNNDLEDGASPSIKKIVLDDF